MPPPAFLDTNILVYAFTHGHRAERARALLAAGGTISVQGLDEFTNVARRKLGMSWPEVTEALSAIRSLCSPVLPVALATHETALDIAQRHGLALYDALMLAAAANAGCTTFWSEDMQDGQVINGQLRIANPFGSAPA